VAAAPSCDPEFPTTNAVIVAVNSVAGLFASQTHGTYELLTTLDGDNQESLPVAAINNGVNPPTIQACFTKAHASGTVLMPLGGFATGIIPPTGIVNGSSDYVLKMYGDINADGNMVYVEYTCDVAAGKLYRNVMAFDAASKPMPDDSQILLSNITANPDGSPCFTYQTSPPLIVHGTNFTFVLDVAVTLTVQTEQIDPVTKQFQKETKALLNVSPRNVFNSWALANIGYTDRIQSTPASVTTLLP
jgi:hypothetical protein